MRRMQLVEANVAKQAEVDRATKLQEDLDAAKQQMAATHAAVHAWREDGAQLLANEQSRHAAEAAALHDEIARLGAVAQELKAAATSEPAPASEPAVSEGVPPAQSGGAAAPPAAAAAAAAHAPAAAPATAVEMTPAQEALQVLAAKGKDQVDALEA
jgi:hypothetical protein